MKKKMLLVVSLLGGLSLFAGFGLASDMEQEKEMMQSQDQNREMMQDREQEHMIYGSQMMTDQERMEYREKLRAAKTAEEREQIRMEHHEQMQERAKAQGMTLPDEPPERGMGYGGGMNQNDMGRDGMMQNDNMDQGGRGGGMGSGGGMESGGGMNQNDMGRDGMMQNDNMGQGGRGGGMGSGGGMGGGGRGR